MACFWISLTFGSIRCQPSSLRVSCWTTNRRNPCMTVFEVTDLIHSIRPDLTDISLATPDVVLFTDGGTFR